MMDKRFQPLHMPSETVSPAGAGCLLITLAGLAVAAGVALLGWIFN